MPSTLYFFGSVPFVYILTNRVPKTQYLVMLHDEVRRREPQPSPHGGLQIEVRTLPALPGVAALERKILALPGFYVVRITRLHVPIPKHGLSELLMLMIGSARAVWTGPSFDESGLL
jgi:hypothetical protein